MEQQYHELNGEEAKRVLLTRFLDLLSRIPEFQRHITLPRVRMTLSVRFEIENRTPPSFRIEDDVTLVSRSSSTNSISDGELLRQVLDAGFEILSDAAEGQHPDEIREEHGIPVLIPERGVNGVQERPVLQPDKQKYGSLAGDTSNFAAFVVQDYGSLQRRQRTGAEAPIAQLTHPARIGTPEVPLQESFRPTRKD